MGCRRNRAGSCLAGGLRRGAAAQRFLAPLTAQNRSHAPHCSCLHCLHLGGSHGHPGMPVWGGVSRHHGLGHCGCLPCHQQLVRQVCSACVGREECTAHAHTMLHRKPCAATISCKSVQAQGCRMAAVLAWCTEAASHSDVLHAAPSWARLPLLAWAHCPARSLPTQAGLETPAMGEQCCKLMPAGSMPARLCSARTLGWRLSVGNLLGGTLGRAESYTSRPHAAATWRYQGARLKAQGSRLKAQGSRRKAQLGGIKAPFLPHLLHAGSQVIPSCWKFSTGEWLPWRWSRTDQTSRCFRL